MSSLALGLALAALASVALNTSYVLQHAGSLRAPDVDVRRPLVTIRGLVSSPLWAIGAGLGVSGWVLHVAALSHAPLSLVQAFVAGTLGLLAPLAARLLRQPMERAEWVAVAAVALALIVLSLGLHDPGAHASARPGAAYAFAASGLALAALLAGLVRSWRPHALGLAGGVLYGVADTAIKALTGVAARHGAEAVVSSPWLALAAIATVCAFFAFQRGLQTARAIPVVVLMTGATTVVSIVGGFAVFADPLGRTPLLAGLHLAGFVLVTGASALLAPAVHPPGRPAAAAARTAAPGDRREVREGLRSVGLAQPRES